MSTAENIRVITRFRPPSAREKALEERSAPPRFNPDGRSVWVGPDEQAGNYAMDAVLSPSATQQDVYAQVSGIVDSVLKGYNGTILAYGQVRNRR